ncbi:hypothetical protein BH10ACT9_BH10ACT9_51870 [soil metagenome]
MSTAETDTWEVVGAKAYNRGDPADGAEETVIASAPEPEARRVYADTVAQAAELEYVHVTLRSAGRDVEVWPQAAGWTS